MRPSSARSASTDRTPLIRAEWLLEPTLRGFNLQDAEGTLRQVLAYRIWFDQRRGWRYTNPNLEQLGMVEVDYLGLEDLAADDELFAGSHPLLKQAGPAARTAVYRELLDHLRKWMAIRSQVLDTAVLEQVVAKSHSRLRPPWGFGMDEKPRAARWLMIVRPHSPESHAPRHGPDRARRLAERTRAHAALDESLGRRHGHSRPKFEGVRPARRRPPPRGRDARSRFRGEHSVRSARLATQRRMRRLPLGRPAG